MKKKSSAKNRFLALFSRYRLPKYESIKSWFHSIFKKKKMSKNVSLQNCEKLCVPNQRSWKRKFSIFKNVHLVFPIVRGQYILKGCKVVRKIWKMLGCYFTQKKKTIVNRTQRGRTDDLLIQNIMKYM